MKKLIAVSLLTMLLTPGICFAGPNAVYSPECDSFKIKQETVIAAVLACHAQDGVLVIKKSPSPVNPMLSCPVSWICSK